MNTSDPTIPTEDDDSPEGIQGGIKEEANTIQNQISEEPVIPVSRSTYVESRRGAMRRTIVKTLRMVMLFAVLAPISISLVGLGCLVAHKGTIYFYLPEEIEKIIGKTQDRPTAAKKDIVIPATPIVEATASVQPAYYAPVVQSPATAAQLRSEYYAKAGMTVQDVQRSIDAWNRSEANRVYPKTRLGYALAYNLRDYHQGRMDEATARAYLDRVIAKYAHSDNQAYYVPYEEPPNVVYIEREVPASPNLWEIQAQEQAEAEARRQQAEAEARQQAAIARRVNQRIDDLESELDDERDRRRREWQADMAKPLPSGEWRTFRH